MYRAYVPLHKMWTRSTAFDKKVTECTSRQKTELKSGSRLNNIMRKSQVKAWIFLRLRNTSFLICHSDAGRFSISCSINKGF
jgi:hypothetical protein